MTRREALKLLIEEIKRIEKAFQSTEIRASCILDFCENKLGMRPPARPPKWEKEPE